MAALVPEGLVLLTSVAFAAEALRLARGLASAEGQGHFANLEAPERFNP